MQYPQPYTINKFREDATRVGCQPDDTVLPFLFTEAVEQAAEHVLEPAEYDMAHQVFPHDLQSYKARIEQDGDTHLGRVRLLYREEEHGNVLETVRFSGCETAVREAKKQLRGYIHETVYELAAEHGPGYATW